MTPEQDAVLRSIRKLIDFWQISAEELLPEGGSQPRAKAPPRAAVAALPKYRHPVSGEIWDGEGMQPAWLRDALTRQGYTVDEMRFKGEGAEPSGGPEASDDPPPDRSH